MCLITVIMPYWSMKLLLEEIWKLCFIQIRVVMSLFTFWYIFSLYI